MISIGNDRTGVPTMKYVISSSFGNDSVALMKWASLARLDNVEIVFCDTGWGSPEWNKRVDEMEQIAKLELGYETTRVYPVMGFEELIRHKKGFPGQKYQWCSLHLKITPFLEYMDIIDPDCEATIMIGKRRAESANRAETPEFINNSEYHGDRTVWHPLYKHSDQERDALLEEINVAPLPHRSMECYPCVNANRTDMRTVDENRIVRIEALEAAVDNTMYRPYRHMGAKGIREVMRWAHSERGKFEAEEESECSSGYCGI